MNNKVLIIGGGLGGLFTGALLSKEGYEVTVLEKNRIIGGGLQCFTRRGDVFETGMHILGGFRYGGSLHKICSYLGIMDKLSIRHTDNDAIDSVTYLSDGKTYDIPKGKEPFIQYLSAEFPDEKENIRAYVDELYRLSNEVDLFYLRKGPNQIFAHSERFLWAADDLIKHYVDNHKLRDLLAYMNPMYGGIAGHTPAYIHALINVLYINGSSRFNGGSQQLADLLEGVIRNAGGEVLPGKRVTEIKIEDKTVSFVKTEKGNIYCADIYISDIHPYSLLEITDQNAFPRSYRNRLSEIPNSYSVFTVYIKFKEDTFPYINHPCYYQEDYGFVWEHGTYNEDGWPKGFMYLTPPGREQGGYASRMIVNCIMDFSVVKRWTDTTVGNRGKEYEEWKQRHSLKVINRLEQLHPGIKEMIDYSFASSPLTIRDYYGVKDGSLYGFRKDCRNIALSQVAIFTKVSNLLLTGQNINLHGICGVPLTAIETVEAVVGQGRVVDRINEHYKQINRD
jgi:all-trans-retinol 13,14-reductase